MNKSDLFQLWAPREGIWSPWAKPVLFAHLTPSMLDAEDATPSPPGVADLTGVPPADGTAVVVDLPGEDGVAAGMALAETGYRPVPLYNACPGPAARVDVGPILSAFVRSASRLRQLALPPAAPPAFLLDADRRLGTGPSSPGSFDNRSVSLPTDFPSASLLLNRGVRRVILISQLATRLQSDLAHTLLRWQRAGIVIDVKRADLSSPPEFCTILRPGRFRSLWHALIVTAGLRRNPLGGFGGMLPEPAGG